MNLKNPDSRKGQAAIEYLMTYGWAMLVIAIVIVALYMLTQVQTRMNTCVAPTGFACSDPLPNFHGNKVDFRLHNQMPNEIMSVSAGCNKTNNAPVSTTCAGSAASGGYIDCINVPCEGLVSGQPFSGYLVIEYTYKDDIPNTPPRRIFLTTSGSSS